MKHISNIISYLLHPILMPTVGVFLMFYLGVYSLLLPPTVKEAILMLVVVTTILMPLVTLGLLYLQKKITNIEMPTRQERLIPMFISIIFYYISYYMLKKYNAPFMASQFIFATFLCLALAFIINIKWKISLHMIGLGGIIGLLSAITYLFNIYFDKYILIFLIILSGITGTSRLILKAHNQNQIYAGFLVGYITTFLTLILFN